MELDSKVSECLRSKVQRSLKRLSTQGRRYEYPIVNENSVLYFLCKDVNLTYEKLAELANRKFGVQLKAETVAKIFYNCHMSKKEDRCALITWASTVADLFDKALHGDKAAFNRFELFRATCALGEERYHRDQQRLAAMCIMRRHYEFFTDPDKDLKSFLRLGSLYCKYFFFDLVSALAEAYGYKELRIRRERFARQEDKYGAALGNEQEKLLLDANSPDVPENLLEQSAWETEAAAENGGVKGSSYRNKDRNNSNRNPAAELSTLRKDFKALYHRYEELREESARTQEMLEEIQDDFDEQLEQSRIQELTEFFAALNSDRYGCILDELLNIRKGAEELRKKRYQLPVEINGLMILIRQLTQFVRDNHIMPIMKPGDIKVVKARDVENCQYEGTPFESEDDEKIVKVISSGWIFKDKEIQISRPKLVEE